ncbi:class I SAM-dependent methyltransferase [Frigidibacter sp. SD6-1]|uniref:class I SAM-dependent DNA methyltransferase n=1 Tax=Frigidibacter sp. SD6-1 TaxID=3032581 RepID=UPI0024DFCA80|nr:class I SAM-dependent methyltransferase [Frigidibacter sp. SD6-1]
MSDDPSLDAAYALEGADGARRLYRDWAASYDGGFAAGQDYLLPAHVARHFAALGGQGPVLDVGAGTGLCAEGLARAGIGPIDGIDLSPEMLAIAATKGLYARLLEADVTRPMALPEAHYRGIVSSGTFTLGHVGPEAIAGLLAHAAPEALVVISVNVKHWESAGFAAALAALSGRITLPDRQGVMIYGPAADPAHREDRAWLVSFRTLA